MISAGKAKNEDQRISALKSYSILDTVEEIEYDDITRLASEICNTPISLISLVDSNRQWFKSHHGLDATETPRDHAFCAHAILNPDELFEVENSLKDERFHDNPLVENPGVIFYTGAPLVTNEGLPLGTLCIIDHSPKKLSENQKESLRALANQVMRLFELRKKNAELEAVKKEIEERNTNLEQFSYVVTHDIKSPLAGIISLSSILKTKFENSTDVDSFKYITSINKASLKLKSFIDGLLDFYKGELLPADRTEQFNVQHLINSVVEMVDVEDKYEINYISDIGTIVANKSAIEQILLNLISNGVKYNDKPVIKISIDLIEKQGFYIFSVTDNGVGIDLNLKDKIFGLFDTLGVKDRSGQLGTGIGLSSVQKLVKKLNSSIEVQSAKGIGSTFTFKIPKA